MSIRRNYENNDLNFIKTSAKRKKSINFLIINKIEIHTDKKDFLNDEIFYDKKPNFLNKRKKTKNVYRNKSYSILTMVFLFLVSFSKNISYMISSNSNIIIVTINKKGNNAIFFTGSIGSEYEVENNPINIIINDNVQESPFKTKYDLDRDENIIQLEFEPTLSRLSGLFYGCENITKIDFSNFDSSLITLTDHLFASCSSLTSIDFGDNSFSSLEIMRIMFGGCISLTSLDLS